VASNSRCGRSPAGLDFDPDDACDAVDLGHSIEQLVAPIALYPDPLLAQILLASTYPLEVVEAARWVSAPANRTLTGGALTNALQAQNWDPIIKARVRITCESGGASSAVRAHTPATVRAPTT
jgi:hypothetical protein